MTSPKKPEYLLEDGGRAQNGGTRKTRRKRRYGKRGRMTRKKEEEGRREAEGDHAHQMLH